METARAAQAVGTGTDISAVGLIGAGIAVWGSSDGRIMEAARAAKAAASGADNFIAGISAAGVKEKPLRRTSADKLVFWLGRGTLGTRMLRIGVVGALACLGAIRLAHRAVPGNNSAARMIFLSKPFYYNNAWEIWPRPHGPSGL